MNRIEELHSKWVGCKRCSLCSTGKQVFSDGPMTARLMLVGEAPGVQELRLGKPFVGPAGQLITSELEKNSIHRNEIYWTNVTRGLPHEAVKTRPPNQAEMEACRPLILEEINIIKPRFILLVGASAIKSLLNHKGAMSPMVGRWVRILNIPALITWHPAALLHCSTKDPERYKIYSADFERDIRVLAEAYKREVVTIVTEKEVRPEVEGVF